jgi:hypothetical protein
MATAKAPAKATAKATATVSVKNKQVSSFVPNGKAKLVWRANRQKVDISKLDNVLAKTKKQLKNKTVIDLTDELSGYKKFQNVIAFLKANDIKFDPKDIPKFEMHKLREILTPEEVQRLLDKPHCAKIAGGFDPRLLSPIYVVRLNGSPDLLGIDSMHTETVVASFAREGLWGNDPEQWLDFEYPCWVIDTKQESFPLLAGLYRNGEGSKPWDEFDHHRVHVRSFRFYGDNGPNDKYKLAADKQTHCEKEDTIPMAPNHPHAGRAGTLTHIKALSSYSDNDMDEFKFVISMNNKYWHGSEVDSAAFGFYGNLYIGLLNGNVPMKGKNFDKFMNDIHAIIKTFFVSFAELRSITTETYKNWMKLQGKDTKAPPFNCALALVLKMYKQLNGQHLVTSDVNMFTYNPAPGISLDIYESLPLNIRQNVNNYEL